MRVCLQFAVVALFGAVWPTQAWSDPIVVSGGGPELAGCCLERFGLHPALGAPFTFRIAFNSSAADINPDPRSGVYQFGPGTVTMSVGSSVLTSAASGISGSTNFFGFLGEPPVGSLSLTAAVPGLLMRLYAPFPLNETDAWPGDVAAAFRRNGPAVFSLRRFESRDGDDDAQGLVTAIAQELAPTPEPSTVAMIGVGLIAVSVGARRRARRVKRNDPPLHWHSRQQMLSVPRVTQPYGVLTIPDRNVPALGHPDDHAARA